MTVGSYSASSAGLVAFGGGAVFPWTPQQLLDNMVKTIMVGRNMDTVWKLGTAIPAPQKHFLVLHPEFVMELDRLGYTRKKMQQYLYDRSRVPYEELSAKEVAAFKRRLADKEIPADRVAVFEESLKAGGKCPCSSGRRIALSSWRAAYRVTPPVIPISRYRRTGLPRL